METPSRRRLLAAGGTLSLAALAGCSALSTDSETPPKQWVDGVTVTNHDADPWDVDVAVYRNESVAAWEALSLERRADDVVDVAKLEILDSERRSGDWVVTARLVGSDATKYVDVREDLPETGGVELELRVTSDAALQTLVYRTG